MLVLSRRRGEKIHIGDAVLTVLAIQGNRVRIGIEAPEQVQILRDEVRRYGAISPLQALPLEGPTQQPR